MESTMNYLRWFLIHRWLVKYAVSDWMLADAHKFKERKQYYFARMEEDFCGIRTCRFIRIDMKSILQLRGVVE